MTALPVSLQSDIRAFFGSYTKACMQADDLLFRSGNAEAVDETCRQARVGKLLPNALYVHRDALDCSSRYSGFTRAAHGPIWARSRGRT
jgi:hypothetical protein